LQVARCQRRGRWGERVVPRRSRSGVIVLRVEMHGGQGLSVAHRRLVQSRGKKGRRSRDTRRSRAIKNTRISISMIKLSRRCREVSVVDRGGEDRCGGWKLPQTERRRCRRGRSWGWCACRTASSHLHLLLLLLLLCLPLRHRRQLLQGRRLLHLLQGSPRFLQHRSDLLLFLILHHGPWRRAACGCWCVARGGGVQHHLVDQVGVQHHLVHRLHDHVAQAVAVYRFKNYRGNCRALDLLCRCCFGAVRYLGC